MKIDKKLFGRDIGLRSTFLKYDPCVTGLKHSVECEDCMVSLISDRFLGELLKMSMIKKSIN